MKRFIFAVSCLYVFTPLFADMPTRSQAHKWGLQFKIDENLSFQALQGLMMSGQYFIKPHFAIRFGMDGSLNTLTRKQDNRQQKSTRDSWRMSLATQAIRIYGQERAFFYWGVGPYWSKTHEEGAKEIPDGWDEGERRWSVSESDLFGINLVAGAEYFVAERISLLFEYGLVAGQENHNLDFPDVSEWKTSTVVVEPQSLKFGVSIYF